MTNTSKVLGVFTVSLAAAAISGCQADVETDEVSQASQAVVGVDSFLYFRSNATGWGVDANTRLLPFVAPNVFARVFDVTQPWMVTGTDTATLTETNQLDGWGTTQNFYDIAGSNQLVVPSTAPIALTPNGGDPHFQVDYAAIGRHRVLVNLNPIPATVSIESEADICATVNCPVQDLHCALLPNGVPTCVPNPPVP